MSGELKPRLDPDSWLADVRERTPARLFVGRAGASYPTHSQLELRRSHAAALDAVRDELDIASFGTEFIERWRLFEVSTEAQSKQEFLARPDKGRRLNEAARLSIANNVQQGCDFQVVIGDGLSATAVRTQVPNLLPILFDEARSRRWSIGRPFVIHHCRVGVMNDIGGLLSPAVVVLLIGERPGLATAESLSAYMAFRPREGHTDANRNLVSNIHGRGVRDSVAAKQILQIADAMLTQQVSGTGLSLGRAWSLGQVSNVSS